MYKLLKKYLVVLSILGILFPYISLGAIAFDASSNGSANTPTTLTVAHTVTGSNTILVVHLLYHNSSETITGITYNGVSMTNAVSVTNPANTNYRDSKWYLVNPTTGTHNIVATWSSAIADYAELLGTSYTGVAQSGTIISGTATSTGNAQTSLTHNVTNTVANSWILTSFKASQAGTFTPGTGQTARVNNSGGTFKLEASDEPTTVTGTYEQSYSTDGGALGSQEMVSMAIAPFVAASSLSSQMQIIWVE